MLCFYFPSVAVIAWDNEEAQNQFLELEASLFLISKEGEREGGPGIGMTTTYHFCVRLWSTGQGGWAWRWTFVVLVIRVCFPLLFIWELVFLLLHFYVTSTSCGKSKCHILPATGVGVWVKATYSEWVHGTQFTNCTIATLDTWNVKTSLQIC